MHYIIDGYNLFFYLFGTSSQDFKSQRQSLIQSMNAKIEFLSLDVSLVFDSYLAPGDGSRSHYHHLEILFTPEGITADDYIIQHLKNSRDPSKELLVTNDKELARRAKHLSAGTQSIDHFLNWLDRRYSNKKRGKSKPIAKFNAPIDIDISPALFIDPSPAKTSPPSPPPPPAAPISKPKLIRPPEEKLLPPVEKSPAEAEGTFEYYLSTFQAAHEIILRTEEAAKIEKKLRKKRRGSK
jgi:predicted RNA-binding protein with PIN domain